MASAQYMVGRKKYIRPQQIVWADNYTIDAVTGSYLPSGTEFVDFIILSDHNKSELSVEQERIETRKRMVNGTMRSYHIADKHTFSFDWSMIPSRAFPRDPNFDSTTGKNSASLQYTEFYTVDGGAGGVELLNWYENHSGPFYMLLAFDKYNEFNTNKYQKLSYYNLAVNVYFDQFDYEVVKRGSQTFDFWNISVSLEEV
jgi:hypothetical protein